jgi:uncharacterized protein (UPF0335 family)
MKLQRLKKKIKLFAPKTLRFVTRGIYTRNNPRTRDERSIHRMVRNVLAMPNTRIYLSSISSFVHIEEKSKRCIISLMSNTFKVKYGSNGFDHKALRVAFGEGLVKMVMERVEEDSKKIQDQVISAQSKHLDSINLSLIEDTRKKRNKKMEDTFNLIAKIK